MTLRKQLGHPLRALALVLVLLAVQACSAHTPSGNPDSPIRIAGVFSGAVTDADYNALGWVALDEAAKKFDAQPKDSPPNLWIIDRNFHNAFYPIGVLAGALTKSGKIGYIGGLSLPFSYSEVHALKQGLKDSGSTATLTSVWTGNFNDPTKAQQITRQMSDQGNDVLIGSMNMGMVGVFQAAKADTRQQWVVGKYTDKSQFSPDDAGASVVYDFVGPLGDIITDILAGKRTGYLPLGFATGVKIVMPERVPAAVRAKADQAVADVISGKVTVVKDTTPVK